ncbi:MAG: hypothetical protein DVB33_02930 [Verrucomicrobia bacterium]|nr:MAG: hypothetical protein DVB33_02930 [Verrucomicrobiota bacterium]
MPAPAKRKNRFWRKCRIYFRRARITVWLVTLAILGTLIYLNLIGLPDFVKRPIITKLRERGIALDFSELRLHWSRGFVASKVKFGSVDSPAAPHLTADDLEFNFHMRALLAGKIQVDSITLRNGKIEWLITQTNEPDRTLVIENIESSLRMLPDDSWMLDDLRGQFAGANFFLKASLLNASAVADWKFGKDEDSVEATRWPMRLGKLADVMDQIKFSSPPELRLVVNGDARDLKSFDAHFMLKTAEADTSWGRASQVLLKVQIFPAATNELSRAEIDLQAASAETQWATTTNLEVKLRLLTSSSSPDSLEAAGTISANRVLTQWGSLGKTHAKAKWIHSLKNLIPKSANVELHTDSIMTLLARAAQVDLKVSLDTVTNRMASDESLSFWNKLLPYATRWTVGVGALKTAKLQAEKISFEGDWTAPVLSITSVKASSYDGELDARGRLDIISRCGSFEVTSDFDLQKLAPFLTERSREWLAKFSWSNPPRLKTAGALILPVWNAMDVDWQTVVRPTLQLAGQVAITNGGYKGIHVDWVTTDFSYTNLTWRLANLEAGRPEGGLQLSHIANDATHQYYFKLHSAVDPRVVLPLLDEGVGRGFDLCEFGVPPVVDGELWGRWYDHKSIGFRGSVAVTNFSFRGQHTDAIVSGLNYTNLVVECIQPRIWRATQHMSADGIVADFNSMRTYFTNGFSTLDPGVVVRAIGPQVTHVMEPYHFGQPPTARFWGYTSMNNPQDADVVFEGAGKDFESLKFRVPEFTARVHWKDKFLTVTNTSGKFYGGHATGWARFVFDESDNATYAFSVDATNANLRQLLADLTEHDNTLDGLMNCLLVVTNATTDDIRSWDGFGRADLRDGLLWELPIFGALSKPLNAVIPGVGNSKFSEASSTYKIKKGIIESKDLEMRSAAMRLQYRGTVNFDGVIRARVEAEPLRDTPVLGPLVSTILSPVAKLFSYKIRGTLSNPIIKPENIPSFLMVPLSPFESIGKLFSTEPPKPGMQTNAPGEAKSPRRKGVAEQEF